MLPVTADDQHAELVRCLQPMRGLLSQMPRRLRWLGDVEQLALRDKADRVESLGSHLEGAMMLVQAHKYDAAFALLRTCLEHAVVDWLVFQGRTFVQRISEVSEDTGLAGSVRGQPARSGQERSGTGTGIARARFESSGKASIQNRRRTERAIRLASTTSCSTSIVLNSAHPVSRPTTA